MELSKTPENPQFCKLGRWGLYKTIGEGSTAKTFLGIDEETKEIACVKVFRSKNFSDLSFSRELEIQKNLDHPRIVKLKGSLEDWDHFEPLGVQMKVNALVMEYMRGGELFELLEAAGRLPEVLARTYFSQLLAGVEYLHKSGICHRDLKPENLLLDENLNLKIADFGCACKLERGKRLEPPVGTTRYQTPEALAGLQIDAQEADLFACGIILFLMVSGNFPFESATQNDYTYRLLNGNQDANTIFWSSHEKITCQSNVNTGRPVFSENFRDLINRILSFDYEERPTIAEIKEHPWMKGPILEDDLIMGYFKGN